MLAAVESGLTTVWKAAGGFLSSLTSETGELAAALPLFGLGIAISLALVGIKIVMSVCWGR